MRKRPFEPVFRARRYMVRVIDGQRLELPLQTDFPDRCIKCGDVWKVRQSRVYNGMFDTTGRSARCLTCNTQQYEVIDEWIGTKYRDAAHVGGQGD